MKTFFVLCWLGLVWMVKSAKQAVINANNRIDAWSRDRITVIQKAEPKAPAVVPTQQ